ncbi:hypothetical protein Tco_0357225 [Tanacetum coccineum]
MPLSDKTILDSHCFVHELKKEMHDDLEYVKSLEKEVDELESEKADFSNVMISSRTEFESSNARQELAQKVTFKETHRDLQGISLETKFNKPSGCSTTQYAQRIPKPQFLVKTDSFSNFPEIEKFSNETDRLLKIYVSDGLFFKQVTQQEFALRLEKQAVRNTTVIAWPL